MQVAALQHRCCIPGGGGRSGSTGRASSRDLAVLICRRCVCPSSALWPRTAEHELDPVPVLQSSLCSTGGVWMEAEPLQAELKGGPGCCQGIAARWVQRGALGRGPMPWGRAAAERTSRLRLHPVPPEQHPESCSGDGASHLPPAPGWGSTATICTRTGHHSHNLHQDRASHHHLHQDRASQPPSAPGRGSTATICTSMGQQAPHPPTCPISPMLQTQSPGNAHPSRASSQHLLQQPPNSDSSTKPSAMHRCNASSTSPPCPPRPGDPRVTLSPPTRPQGLSPHLKGPGSVRSRLAGDAHGTFSAWLTHTPVTDLPGAAAAAAGARSMAVGAVEGLAFMGGWG